MYLYTYIYIYIMCVCVRVYNMYKYWCAGRWKWIIDVPCSVRDILLIRFIKKRRRRRVFAMKYSIISTGRKSLQFFDSVQITSNDIGPRIIERCRCRVYLSSFVVYIIHVCVCVRAYRDRTRRPGILILTHVFVVPVDQWPLSVSTFSGNCNIYVYRYTYMFTVVQYLI